MPIGRWQVLVRNTCKYLLKLHGSHDVSFCRMLDGTFMSEFHWEMPNQTSLPAGKLHLNTFELVDVSNLDI